MPKVSYSAFGRLRAAGTAGPVQAPARGGALDSGAQTTSEANNISESLALN